MNITHTISNKNQLEADFSRDIWCVLGLPFDNVTLNQTCNIITNAVEQKRHCFLSTPNLNFLCATQTDSDFRDSVQNSNLSIADGFPIIVIAKFLGIPLSERVAGSTLIEKLQTHSRKPIRVFFFGGEESAGEKAVEKINHSNQALKAVGSYYPAFGSIDDMSADDIIENINQAQADFVIVALGAKKGQAWIEKNRKKINAPVISHLGAVINFFAGSVKRAPPLFQKIGLEWVWRIYQEPKLWKRYWQDGLTLIHLFFAKVLPSGVNCR